MARIFYTHAFDEGQANFLYEMLRRVGDDWRKEWTDYCLDASLTVEDVALKAFTKLDKELQSHHDALVRMRGQMDLLVGKASKATSSRFRKSRTNASARAPCPTPWSSDSATLNGNQRGWSGRSRRWLRARARAVWWRRRCLSRLTTRVNKVEGRLRKIEEEIE